MPDSFSNQLSAFLDGELDSAAAAGLEAHLAECAECSRVLADLRAIVAAAPHYAGRAPSSDLWKDIESRLDEAEVVPIGTVRPTDRPSIRPSSRRFGWVSLIAASLAMAAVGGGAVWLALRPAQQSQEQLAIDSAPVPASVPGARTVEFAEQKYAAAVQDLEQLLAAGQGRLDSATVRLVEENLRKIDAAVAEARAAVQRDPANTYLNRQIAANMRLKLNLLRTATNAIAART